MNKKIVYYSIHCYDKLDIAAAIQRISDDPNLTYEVEVLGDVTIVSALPMPKAMEIDPEGAFDKLLFPNGSVMRFYPLKDRGLCSLKSVGYKS